MSWIGITAIPLGILFSAYAGNEWIRSLGARSVR